MSLLSELNAILDGLNMPVETGIFSGVPPNEYAVLTPMTDEYPLYADNAPQIETQEVRLSFFSKGNYRARAWQIAAAILETGVTITERRYVGFDTETDYHNYAIDTILQFETEV